MIERIVMQEVVPAVFRNDPRVQESQVWGRRVELRRGRSYLIEAVSGAGKSSLCGFLYGYRTDYDGRILFDGADCRAFSPAHWAALRRHSLGMLFQELRLFAELTVAENIAVKNRLTHYRSEAGIGRMLEAVGLADKRDVPVGRLSLGQQQRVAFVRALCQPLDFILLDEPVSHLDAVSGGALAELLGEEVRRAGTGIVVTSVGNRLAFPYDELLKL